MDEADIDITQEVFLENRGLLFAVAYRILASVADAEDAVQDSWLKWSRVDSAQVDHPKAYLVRTVTNTALNRLRQLRNAREDYIGPWLPGPLLTTPDASAHAERNESVSMAMLVVLETLSPEERAVFILREVFGYSYAEIADALQRNQPSVRQLAHRARSHVQARRPRFDTDVTRQRVATEKFLHATVNGDVDELLRVLAPEVTLHVDGGGAVRAPRNVIVGANKAARFLAAISHGSWEGVHMSDVEMRITDINGSPGIMGLHQGEPISTVSLQVTQDTITQIFMVANPRKLSGLLRPR